MQTPTLDSLHFTVADLESVQHFYRELLGFVPERAGATRQAAAWVRMRSGSSSLTFCQAQQPAALPSDPRAGFRGMSWAVESLTPYRQALERHGDLSAQKHEDAETRRLSFQDPDGNGLALLEYRDAETWRERSERGWALFRQIDHVRFGVADLRASLAFYRDLLGFTLRRVVVPHGAGTRRIAADPEGPLPADACGIILAGADAVLSLHRSASGVAVRAPRFEHMGWKVEHLEACRERLADYAVDCEADRAGRQLMLRDPNGRAAAAPNLELTGVQTPV